MKLNCAGLLHIHNRKLLLAFSENKRCFYLPGGKLVDSETPAEALCREIAEELNVRLHQHELEFYTHITAPAYGEKEDVMMEQDCFFLHRELAAQPSAEIGSLKYFSLGDYLNESSQAPGAVQILQKLQVDGYID